MTTVLHVAAHAHSQSAHRTAMPPDLPVLTLQPSNCSSTSLSKLRTCLSSEALAGKPTKLGRKSVSLLDQSSLEVDISTESLRKLSSAPLLSSAASSESDSDQVCSQPTTRAFTMNADASSDSGRDSADDDDDDDDLSSDDEGSSADLEEEALVFVAERKRVGVTRQNLSATAVSFPKHTATATTRRRSGERRNPATVAERAQPPDVPTEASYTNDESTLHQSQLSSGMDDAEEVRLYHSGRSVIANAGQSANDSFASHVSQPTMHLEDAIMHAESRPAVHAGGVGFELLQSGPEGEQTPREGRLRSETIHDGSISQATFAIAGWSLVQDAKRVDVSQEAIGPSLSVGSEILRKSSFSSTRSHSSFQRQPFQPEFAAPKRRQDSALVQTALAEEQRREAGIMAQQQNSFETMSSASIRLRSFTSFCPGAGGEQHWNGNSSALEELTAGPQDEHHPLLNQAQGRSPFFVVQQEEDYPYGRARSIKPSIGAYSELSNSSQSIRTVRNQEQPLLESLPPTRTASRQDANLFLKEVTTSPQAASFDRQSIASKDATSPSFAGTQKASKLKSSSKADLEWDGELGQKTVRTKKSFFGRSRKTSQTSVMTSIIPPSRISFASPSLHHGDDQAVDTDRGPKGSSVNGETSGRPYQQGPPSPMAARSSTTAPNTPSVGESTQSMASKQQSQTIGRWSDAINLSRNSRVYFSGNSSAIDFPLPNQAADYSVVTPQTHSAMQKQRIERLNYPPSSSQTRPSFIRSPSMDSTTSSMESGRTNTSGKRSLLNRIGIASRRSKSISRGPSVKQDDGRSSEYDFPVAPTLSPRRDSESTTEVIDDRLHTGNSQNWHHETHPANPPSANGKPSSMRRKGSLASLKNAFDSKAR